MAVFLFDKNADCLLGLTGNTDNNNNRGGGHSQKFVIFHKSAMKTLDHVFMKGKEIVFSLS